MELLTGLANALSGNLALYVGDKEPGRGYPSAARIIIEITEAIAKTCYEMTPEAVVAASSASVQLPPDTRRTDDIHLLTERLTRRAGVEEKTEVLKHIDELGQRLGKG